MIRASLALLFAASSALAAGPECNAPPDASRIQYVVGYGSLMQGESRARTTPSAGPAHPVEVRGFRRGWYARAPGPGLGATYLSAVQDPQSRMNAVLYQVDLAELKATDQRERLYCRIRISFADVSFLEPQATPPGPAQGWIYVSRPGTTEAPAAQYPIVQSYVDLFLSGCLEQEQRFGLAGFAQECIASTADWSADWVNDRIFPRRPFAFQPKAREIDALLYAHLRPYFERIRIESAN